MVILGGGNRLGEVEEGQGGQNMVEVKRRVRTVV